MKFVIQRVKQASVTADGSVAGRIGKGLLVLVGVGKEDTADMKQGRETACKMVGKLVNARIFEDSEGKTNLALSDVAGELLMISQFTLYANSRKGNRPSFIEAGEANLANELYEFILMECKKEVAVVEKGVFGEHMDVALLNDGPFTIILDSKEFGR